MTKKVLIADDDDLLRDAIRLSIQKDGYEIHEARDGIEALNKAAEVIPDLIILDVMMPGMIGYNVCQKLKSNPATKDIFVMYLTARGNELTDGAVKESGGDGFFAKPFLPTELRKKVRDILESR